MNTYSVALFLRKTVKFGLTVKVKERMKLYIIPANLESDAFDMAKEKANIELPGFNVDYFAVKKHDNK